MYPHSQITDMDGWDALNRNDSKTTLQVIGPTVRLTAADGVVEDTFVIYWLAPDAYLGKRVCSMTVVYEYIM